ncbi:hypothetical protein BZA05DRAFT_430365 [Tricharina praecox]|uniref:uncharacterized protein n=1 Tax=Tricharina praecox TaxID=43433 RepID=UPI00221EC5D2|nr:uncharacterized protein BZA05DRAFT_430365 [Tricharina praecox]KAI5851014.1 hypothetical protein BZA05DRAFT_430365 [Tricharina praecox]
MVRVLQSQIPTLPLLYKANKLSIVDQSLALYAASSAINAKIGIIRTDITGIELENGAIVNAANQRLLGGSGVDGAIHRAAGPGLLAECRTLSGARTGQSKITDAYRLPCKKVIHSVGPIYSMAEKPHELLRSCYQTSLDLAVKNGLNAIAFSALSTGVYGYPSYPAARVALDTVRKFMETDDGAKLDLVVFCNFEKKDENAYNELASLPTTPRLPSPKPRPRKNLRKSKPRKCKPLRRVPRLPTLPMGSVLVPWLPAYVLFVDNVASLEKVSGLSMSPTFCPDPTRKDWILASHWRCTEGLRRGMVVLYRSPIDPERQVIKRIVALEGDVVRTRRARSAGSVGGAGGAAGYHKDLVVVPKGQAWMEGDEMFHSVDSNTYGPVPIALITSRVTHIVWPLDRVLGALKPPIPRRPEWTA